MRLAYRQSYKRAVRRAVAMKNKNGWKCIVLFVNGKYMAFPKHAIKSLVQQKYFTKGTTIQHIESLAAFITN